MKNLSERITTIVINAVSEAVEELGADYDVTSRSRIYGGDSPLDSTGLVSVVVDIEARLEGEMDLVVSLTDERAVSQENSPFWDVPSMVAFILDLWREQADD